MEKKPVNKKLYLILGIVLLIVGIALTVISNTTENASAMIFCKAFGYAGIAAGAAALVTVLKKGPSAK